MSPPSYLELYRTGANHPHFLFSADDDDHAEPLDGALDVIDLSVEDEDEDDYEYEYEDVFIEVVLVEDDYEDDYEYDNDDFDDNEGFNGVTDSFKEEFLDTEALAAKFVALYREEYSEISKAHADGLAVYYEFNDSPARGDITVDRIVSLHAVHKVCVAALDKMPSVDVQNEYRKAFVGVVDALVEHNRQEA